MTRLRWRWTTSPPEVVGVVVVVAEVVPRPQQLREAAVREAVAVEEELWVLAAEDVVAVERHHRIPQLERQMVPSRRHQDSRRLLGSRRALSSRRCHHHPLLRLLLR